MAGRFLKSVRLLVATVVTCCGLAFLGASAFAQAYPNKAVNFVVPTDPGGSLDRMARILAPYFSKELGVPVNVVNKPGGNSLLGHQYVLQLPADGYNIIVSPAAPQLVMQTDMGLVNFKAEDFAFMNAQWTDYAGVFVPNDRPWKTWGDVVAVIKANPGKLVMITVPSNERQVIMLALLKLAGLSANDVRIVTYNSGNEIRTASINGQTDVAFTTVEGSETISDRIHPIMMITKERLAGYENIQTIGEVIGKENLDKIPLVSATVRTLAVPLKMKKDFPDRWNKLLAVYQKVLADPEAKAKLKSEQMGSDWTGPDVATEMILDYGKLMKPFLSSIQQK
jgi:tripartite-type tricarboxylate transporter receptor subunit TctC